MEECEGVAKEDCSGVVFHVNVSLYLCECMSFNVSTFPITIIIVMQKLFCGVRRISFKF